jgi:hypothetical protein
MRYIRFLLVLPLLALVACDDDGVSVNPVPDAALVRFINASPTPGAVDVRFIDRVENLPTFFGVAYRGHTGAGFHRVEPGTRHLRIFPTSTDPSVSTQQLVNDPNFILTANQRSTLLLTHESGAHTLTRIEEPATIQRAPAGQIAVQVIHGATGEGNVNVYVVPTPIPAAGAWRTDNAHVFRNVGPNTATGYVNLPVLTGTSLYMFIVTDPVPAGQDEDAAVLFNATPDQPGAPTAGGPGETAGPLPGVRIPESVLTAILTPAPGGTIRLVVDRTLDPQ